MSDFVLYIGEDETYLKKNAVYFIEEEDRNYVLLNNGLNAVGWASKKKIRPVKNKHPEKEEDEEKYIEVTEKDVDKAFDYIESVNKIKNQLELMKTYLLHKLDIEDFHGVYDCAIDMRCLHEKIQWIKENK